MKKRIIASVLALVMALLCLPFTAFAEGDAQKTQNTSDASYELDDFARYGTSEEYAIVPCNAGSSCVDDGGTEIHLWRTHRRDNQIWTLVKAGDSYYIKNKANGKVIDVPYAKAESGVGLECYDYHGGDNQLWRLESMGDGTYAIHSKLNDSLVWNVRGDVWDNGAAIQLYRMNGEANERFRFVHTSTIEPMSEWGSSRQNCSGSNWSVWDGSCSYAWYDSRKNERDLYINTAADLFGLASLVANGYEMLGKTIHLTRDINLAGITWTPIGYYGHYFKGSFNGHNHAIVGFNRIDTSEGSDYTGLFGKVAGGTICNLAVKGTLAGDQNTGGIVGLLQSGHLCNIYSEVNIRNCTDVKQGGICGEILKGGLVDHCTQNAPVSSTDYDDFRGGIAGYSEGTIRYSVNNATISHNWDYAGGIVGTVSSGVVEFCANHGTVSGGGRTKYIGGIAGWMTGESVILGCYNDGSVFINDNDYAGGICGYASRDWCVICCINDGRVSGDDQIGGICGEGRPIKCLNTGVVTGHEEVGAISGNARSDTPWCYALAYSAANLSGKEGSRAEWVTATEIISGRICYELDLDPVTNEYYGITAPLSQNIGSDPMPTFGSSKVIKSGNSYMNNEYVVTVECERGYGSVTGAGIYKKGDRVTLTPQAAAGCGFQYFQVQNAGKDDQWVGYNGSKYDHPTTWTKTMLLDKDNITLTNSIDKCYTVRAVFSVFDDVPVDMKVWVKLQLECTNDADGWNNSVIPVTLVDSAGEEHHWSVNVDDLNKVGARVNNEFYLGAASPVAVRVAPDFGGGLTFRDYGLMARLWFINSEESGMVSGEVTIRSWPFVSSVYGDDYMNISFSNFGNSTVGDKNFTKCSEAWEYANYYLIPTTIVLNSAWLIDSPLVLESGKNITVDLNGYPIVRTIKKTQDDGELFKIAEGATLTIIDSTPSRKSCGSFTGGSIQGGRSNNTGGLIECKGTLNIKGCTLYNGGTTDKGGAIKLSGNATANLTGTLISDCWSDKAVTYQNEGGAVYMKDSAKLTMKDCTVRNCRAYDYGGAIYMEDTGNVLTCDNVSVIGCKADDNQGGGVYQDEGETNWIGGSIVNCRAVDDDGGGFYVNNGKVTMRNVLFDGNNSGGSGGAFCSDADDGAWFFGCTFQRNNAGDQGGAIYVDNDNIYMEDCTVVSNNSGDEGGGVYLASPSTIGFAGTVVIRNNDGAETFDNLVLGSKTYFYDHGLEPGSEIHLRGESDGSVKLGGSMMSDYQLNQYFRADHGRLELTEIQTVNTELRASIFSEGTTVIIIGAVILVSVIAGGAIYYNIKKKGARSK